jgi:uncharacterized protein
MYGKSRVFSGGGSCVPAGRRCVLRILWMCLVTVTCGVELLHSANLEDPMDRREEKLKELRRTRDLFFKQDPQSPLPQKERQRFKGLSYYSIDLKYALTGEIELAPPGPKTLYVTLETSKGPGKKYVKYGRFDFRIDGRDHSLQVYRPLGGGDLFLPFKDSTSETETHRDGRYLHIEPRPGGAILVDFNRAYNPFCEFDPKFSCPVPPRENWLEFPIRAGEKRFR